MSNLTFSHISGIIDLKDLQAYAYFNYCMNKLGKNQLAIIQTLTDSYAENLAKSFIEKYQEFLANNENRVQVLRFLASRGADKPHSGKRCSEMIYKNMMKSAQTEPQVEEKEDI